MEIGALTNRPKDHGKKGLHCPCCPEEDNHTFDNCYKYKKMKAWWDSNQGGKGGRSGTPSGPSRPGGSFHRRKEDRQQLRQRVLAALGLDEEEEPEEDTQEAEDPHSEAEELSQLLGN